MNLDLSSLARAIRQMENALEYCNSDLAKADTALAAHLRAAAIQAFEFTYELCIKMIKRWLEKIEPNELAVKDMTFDELIRRAWDLGLLNEEVVQWREFKEKQKLSTRAFRVF